MNGRHRHTPDHRWRPSPCARLFARAEPGALELAGDEIFVTSDTRVIVPALAHDTVRIERDGAWWTLTAPGARPLRGLSTSAVREFRAAIEGIVAEHDAGAANERIAAWWAAVRRELADAWSARRWVAEQSLENWDALRTAAWHPLSQPATEALLRIVDAEVWDAVQSPKRVRELAAAQNAALVEVELRDHRGFFNSVEKSPLTDEQAEAVVCFDNRVLLVASAGSGKTSTIVAKAGWTVRQGIARPDEILLLAYNKAAADELGERLTTRLTAAGISSAGIEAQTFHAFGLRVIGESTGRKPRLAAGLDVDNGLGILATVVDQLKAASAEFATKWWLMQNVLGVPLDDEQTLDPDSYDRDNKRTGFHTLNGDVVKSAGERAIANWLIQCGVDALYEYPYPVDVADEHHSQYHPDFYYPAAGVWHEHWAFVDGEEVPPSFAGYLESRAWKKALHAQHGTPLIETSASQLSDGTLFEFLDAQLRAHGITPEFDPTRTGSGEPLLSDREMLTLFRTFLTHAKSNRLDDAALRSRVQLTPLGTPNWRQSTFLDLFNDIRLEWDRRLHAAGEVDFDDMLSAATDAIESGSWQSPYRVVLVDEFQDASRARARMIAALVAEPDRFLFAVGDDWQSIYRFTGSDISVMTHFEQTFGRGQVLRLERTFRNGQELSTIAGDFVMANPAQLRKSVRSSLSHPAPIKLVRAETDAAASRAIAEHLAAIGRQLAPSERVSVKVLGRYRRGVELLPARGDRRIDVTYQTIHASKGLEADHVIVVGLDRGGFPSIKQDDPILRLAMPDADPFPYSEERRLFYVALTRARKSVLLIARTGRESEFVTELLQRGAVSETGAAAAPAPKVCPKCGRGLLVERKSRYGIFLACNRFPACDGKQSLRRQGR